MTSAPFHPATNGLAERAMQIVKKGLKKENGGIMASRLAKVLMVYRTTPQSTTGVSPSELLQGGRIRTRLDLLKPNVTERVEQSQLKQKLSHDSIARRMYFSKGETVYAQKFGTGQKWMPAIVQDVTGPVSFLVKLEDGCLIRRHQDHLRRRVTESDIENLVEPDDISEILIDLFAVELNTPATESTGQGGLTTRNTQESTTDPGTPGPNGPTPESSPGTTAGDAIAKNAKGSSRAPKTYPKRQRKQPDWYHDH